MRAVRRACRVAGVVGDGKIGLVISPISDRARSVLLFFYGNEDMGVPDNMGSGTQAEDPYTRGIFNSWRVITVDQGPGSYTFKSLKKISISVIGGGGGGGGVLGRGQHRDIHLA